MIQPRWSLLSSFAGGLLGLLALACPGTPLLAQGAPPAPTLHRFSAKQCVRYALDNNQNIRQAKLDVLTSKQDVREAIGQGLPQINGFMGLQNNYILPTTLIPTEDLVGGMAPGGAEQEFVEAQFGTDWFANAGVEMSQLLFDGKYFLGVSASREVVDVNRRRQEITEAQTIAGVRSAYYQVLVAKKNVELISANLKRLEKLHSDTKAYVDEGFAEHIELKRVEVQLNNLRTRRANARDGISLAKRVLKLRMGMPQSHRIILTDSLALNDFNISALDTSITVQPATFARSPMARSSVVS